MTDHLRVDTRALEAAAAVSAASYGSFAEATRSVLDLLQAQMPPDAAIALAHLDRAQDRHRIIDERNGTDFGLHANATIPLLWSLDAQMAEDRAPRLVGDITANAVYSEVPHQRRLKAASYLGVPLDSRTVRASPRCRACRAGATRSSTSTCSWSRCWRGCSPTSSSASQTSAT